MSVNYEVPGVIYAVNQETTDLCWLAATTMLLAWKRQTMLSMDLVAQNLGPEFQALYSTGQRLSEVLMRTLISRADFRSEGGQSMGAEDWGKELKQVGPIVACVDDGVPNNKMVHSSVLFGILGDGSLERTNFHQVDPALGHDNYITFKAFLAKFEADEPSRFPFNLYYNKP